MTAHSHSAPLVILGIDAGDPGFIETWAREGHLPAIASIMERGAWARTGGPELLSEHGVWVSLFSGISRAEHGYYYFRQLRSGSYDLVTRNGLDVDAPPFWTELSGDGRRIAAMDVPDGGKTEGLEGVELLNWATHNNWGRDHYPTSSQPPEVHDDVRARFGDKLVTVENEHATLEEDMQIYRELLRQCEVKGAACRYVVEHYGPFDVVIAVFAGSHAANHQFWKYRPELAGARGTYDAELRFAVRDVYSAIDRQIGLLLERLPKDANVVLVSSVGMEDDFPTTGLVDAFFRGLGYQAAPPKGGLSLRPLDLARRILPESLRVAVSRPFTRDRREQLLADAFRSSTDWTRTTAFAVPAAYTSFVRVNLRGREPLGIVEPGADYDRLLDRIEDDLRALEDVETAQPAVVGVHRSKRAFQRDLHPDLPDMFVDWRPGRFLRRVLHPRMELTQDPPDFNRRSDHSCNGFFAAAGPSVRRLGRIDDVDVLCLAPTFLRLLGKPPGPRMTAGPIRELFR